MPEPVVLQPDLYIGGMRVAEPVTSLTALMISAVCTYAWVRLKRTTPPHPVQTLVRGFFLLMALATLSGGILGHALLYKFSLAWKLPGWVLSMVAIAALERAAIVHARPLMGPGWGRVFGIMNIVELAIFMTLALTTLNFHFVEIHAGYGLVVVIGLFEGYVYRKRRDPGSRLILSAIPVAAVAVLAHLTHFSISVWFTYFDLGHVLMCVGAYLMLRGAEEMRYYDPEGRRARIFLKRRS